MREGNIFSLFVSPHPRGYPSPWFFPRSLVPGPFWEHSSPRLFPRSLVPGPFHGVPQSWPGRYPSPGWGYPQPGQDGIPPPPVRLGWDTPPPARSRWGTPPPPHKGQNSRVSTCYAAGSMPLAFTQKDFFA